ncbi:MAG: hypothetical protein C0601_00650 [Candidatus Muiribacterium halophilum]|uniref:DUF2344 domain-containing protein n=1 Tax=Muiribacterium halophilum TaxID=2053465 RepID=A0A2N5ZMR7_MUIH1|nr:MAG: hypothetical protein C0601_00650 [Candidatus Muirbacterium halophilum]
MRLFLGFKVKGDLKWISHIEYIRLFERMFKRVDMNILYSRGFNPHPKIKLPVPKSIGIESEAEYCEFECDHDDEQIKRVMKELIKLMNKNWIDIFKYVIVKEGEKALSKRIDFIKYRFYGIIGVPEIVKDFKGVIEYYLKDDMLEMKVERDFSFSKFSREFDFKSVDREIILK